MNRNSYSFILYVYFSFLLFVRDYHYDYIFIASGFLGEFKVYVVGEFFL